MFERNIIYIAMLSTQKLGNARFMASCAIFMACLLRKANFLWIRGLVSIN